jgi:hypothetical protein
MIMARHYMHQMEMKKRGVHKEQGCGTICGSKCGKGTHDPTHQCDLVNFGG